MLGLEVEDIVVDGRAYRDRVEARDTVTPVPASGQRLLAPGGEFLCEVAETVDRFLVRGREVFRRREPLMFDLANRRRYPLKEPVGDAHECRAPGLCRRLGAGREQWQQPPIDALHAERGFAGLAGPPLVGGGQQRRQGGGES